MLAKTFYFFLDGHYSAGDTGKNGMDCPLIEELKIIERECINGCLIIIDDADMFEQSYPELSWKGINEENIFNALSDRIDNYLYVSDVRSKSKKRLVIILNKRD